MNDPLTTDERVDEVMGLLWGTIVAGWRSTAALMRFLPGDVPQFVSDDIPVDIEIIPADASLPDLSDLINLWED